MGIASLGGILTGTGDVSTPKTAWTGKNFRGLLDAYTSGLPTVLGAEQQYRPQFNALALQNLQTTAPGMADIFARLLPAATSTVRGINPGQTGLLNTMTSQAQQGLNSGAALDPSLARVAQQSIRGGQAARGLGYGPADVLQESSALTQLGEGLRQSRQGFAGNVAGLNNAFDTGPIMNLLTSILGGSGSINASNPSMISPNLSSNLLTMPYQSKMAANTATAANNTGLYQSMDSNSNIFAGGL